MNNDFTAVCHIESAMDKYIRNIRAMNKARAYEYHFRLTNFENSDWKITTLTAKMVLKMFNDVLSNYIHYLQSNSNVLANVAALNGRNIITCHSTSVEEA
jgi:hypothetical protein